MAKAHGRYVHEPFLFGLVLMKGKTMGRKRLGQSDTKQKKRNLTPETSKRKKGSKPHVNRQELVRALTIANIALQSTLSNTPYFNFSNDEIGAVGDARRVVVPFHTGINATVLGEKLLKVLKESAAEEVVLSIQNNNLVVIEKGSKNKFGTRLVAQEEMERVVGALSIFDKQKIQMSLPEDFGMGLFLCLFSTSKDPVLGPLCGVCVDCTRKVHTASSTDDHRVSEYQFKKPLQLVEERFVLSAKAIRNMAGIVDLVKYDVVDEWVLFLTEENAKVALAPIALGEDFPNVSKVFRGKSSDIVVKFPNVQHAIKKAGLIVDVKKELEREIFLSFKKDELVIKAEHPETGWIEESVEFDNTSGVMFDMKVNPVFLETILKHAMTMYYIEGMHQVIFETKNYKHLMVLPAMQ